MKRKTAEGQDREREQEREQGSQPPPRPPPPTPIRIIRIPDSRPWRRPERPRPMVYSVDSSGFRRLVQSLTGNSPQPPPLPVRPRPVLAQRPPPPPAVMGDELGVMVWPSSQNTAAASSSASSSASPFWSPATTRGDSSYPFPSDGEQQN